MAKKLGLCYNRLGKGHLGDSCTWSRECGIDGCKDRHLRLLHKLCRGNHYHLLITGNFKTKSGNIVKASQTYIYEWLDKWMTKEGRPKASCKAVKYFDNYIEYLKAFPHQTRVYSQDMIDLTEEGYFNPTEEQWNTYLLHANNTQEEMEDQMEMTPKIKLTPPDKTFIEIKDYLNESGARNQKAIVRWAHKLPQNDPR